MDAIIPDIIYAVRQLRRGRATTVVALLTVAVGIAAATVMLSVVNAVLLRPLPYREANRLVNIDVTTTQERGLSPHGSLTPPELFQAWRHGAKSATEFAAFSRAYFTLDVNGETRDQRAIVVTSNMFAFLGARPMLGRTFVPTEDVDGTAPVAVLSYELWQTAFGGDSDIVGRKMQLSKHIFEIVGVMPQHFFVPNSDDGGTRTNGQLWVPIGVSLDVAHDDALNVMALLANGATLNALQTELDRITATTGYASDNTDRYKDRVAAQITPMRALVMTEIKTPVLMLLGAVLSVLLIICANVAGLQLTRLTSRTQEFALRLTLGATRARLARLVFVENMVLAVTGGTLGIMLSIALFPLVVARFGNEVPNYGPIGVDLRVLLMVVAVIVVMGTVFGTIAALLASNRDQRADANDGQGGSGINRKRVVLGNGIVIGEMALTMVMLGFTGLLTRNFLQLTQSSRGYDAHATVTTYVEMPEVRSATPEQRTAFAHAVLTRMQQLPGVTSAVVAQNSPLTTSSSINVDIVNDSAASRRVRLQSVQTSDGYLTALGIHATRGRLPSAQDNGRAFAIDEPAAVKVFPNENPIGKTVRFADNSGSGVIVGVVNAVDEIYPDSKHGGYSRNRAAHIYLPVQYGGSFTVLLKTDLPAVSIASSVKQALHEVDQRIVVNDIRDLQANIDSRYSREHMLSELSIGFAVIALLVAAGGLYAVVSYGATQRTREFGIRLALGAQNKQIATLTLRRGVWLAVRGISAGALALLALAQVLRSRLFEISPADPLTFALSIATVGAVALTASFIPAQRATKVEVVTALRSN